jgi:hypothetical protein
VKAGKAMEAAKLVAELLADLRPRLAKDSPQLAGYLAQFGSSLLEVKAGPLPTPHRPFPRSTGSQGPHTSADISRARSSRSATSHPRRWNPKNQNGSRAATAAFLFSVGLQQSVRLET